jgi:FkbM family methyltransferase
VRFGLSLNPGFQRRAKLYSNVVYPQAGIYNVSMPQADVGIKGRGEETVEEGSEADVGAGDGGGVRDGGRDFEVGEDEDDDEDYDDDGPNDEPARTAQEINHHYHHHHRRRHHQQQGPQEPQEQAAQSPPPSRRVRRGMAGMQGSRGILKHDAGQRYTTIAAHAISIDEVALHDEKLCGIKVDVEGYEAQALQSAAKLLARKVPVPVLQVHARVEGL